MAEKEDPSHPSRIQEVRKQWAVREDGALAYEIQNEEISQHYGLNRYHRRQVREDIPVAKLVQSDEELRQQEERFRELEVLKIQAEEDAKLAKKITRHMRREDRNHRDHENRDHGIHEARNHRDHESRNHTGMEFTTRNHGEVVHHAGIEVRKRIDPQDERCTRMDVRNRRDLEDENHIGMDVRNWRDPEDEHRIGVDVRNRRNPKDDDHIGMDVRNWRDSENEHHIGMDLRNRRDPEDVHHIQMDVKNQRDTEDEHRRGMDVRNRTGQVIRSHEEHDIRHPKEHMVRNHAVGNCDVREVGKSENFDLRDRREHQIKHQTEPIENYSDQDIRNSRDRDIRNHKDHEPIDDEELARQLQEKERRKYERHLERKKEKKLKKEREKLEAELARDLEEARLAVSAENGNDRVAANMDSLVVQGVSVTRVTAAGRIEDNGDFSDFYHLPDEMDEVTRLEIQASQDEELAKLLQEQEHKRTKAKVDPEKMKRIELHDEHLARIIQEEEKLRLRKARQKQARKEAKRVASVESMPLGASANSLNQQKQLQEIPPDLPTSITPSPAANSGHQRYRSNSYTRACDSPPSPSRSPAQRHRGSPRDLGVNHERPRIPSHETLTPGVPHDLRTQYYAKNLHEKQPSTSSSTSSPITAQSSPGKGLSSLETARQIATGNPEGILAIQNSQRHTNDRRKGMTERDRFIKSQEMLDVERFPVHGQHGNVVRAVRRGSDPYRHITDPCGEAAVYAQPYMPHGALLGSELRQSAEAVDVRGYLTDESGSSGGGSASKLSHLHKLQQRHLHHHHHQQQQAVDSNSADGEGPQHPSSSGFVEFNIVAALDPTYQRRHPEACLLHETPMTSQIPFSRSLPQADGELEWDPNLRGSLRKPKAQMHDGRDPSTVSSLGSENAIGGEPVMSPWQPVQGQRRRDPGSRGKAQQRNVVAGDKKGNCKQQ